MEEHNCNHHKCPTCGAVADGTGKCEYCGTVYGKPVSGGEGQPVIIVAQTNNERPEKMSEASKWVLAIVLSLVFFPFFMFSIPGSILVSPLFVVALVIFAIKAARASKSAKSC